MKKKSFTLIEILVVITILGILISLITGNFLVSLKKGRDARRKADLENIQKALEMYYEDKRTYPPSITFKTQLKDDSSGKVYMQIIPDDPNSNQHYYYSSSEGSYKLYACLENNQQILSIQCNPPAGFVCSSKCKDINDKTIPCVWCVSSPNVSP